MTSLTINIDFDGVINDFRAQAERMMKRRGMYVIEDSRIPDWYFYRQWFTTKGQVDDGVFWDMVVDDLIADGGVIFNRGPLIGDCDRIINDLYHAGHHINIVTSKVIDDSTGRINAMKRTSKMLESYDIPYHDLIFLTHKDSHKRAYPADVVIDDCPDLKWTQKGALNILYAQPWNTEDEMVRHWNANYEENGSYTTHGRRATWDDIPILIADFEADLENYQSSPPFESPSNLVSQDEGWVINIRTHDPEPAEQHALDAINLVFGDREADYGHPYDDYSRTVNAFNALTGHELSVLEGGLFMVLVKLSRQMNMPKPDNMVDAHGYLMVMDRILDRENEQEEKSGPPSFFHSEDFPHPDCTECRRKGWIT